ncbi:olfactory receptor 142-like [Chanos chanos]|uniref:Olfactory receptor n=1 Tax=Chanos chanos TaxID=29144 RepID=A0A6J2VLA4_CHACN|nr:olfactory receptor 142-like [Chanos chanos]
MVNATRHVSIILSGYMDLGHIRYFYFSVITLLYLVIIFANTLLIGVIFMDRTLHEPMYLFLCSLFVNELYGSTALFPALLVNVISNIHEVSLTFCFTQIFCLYTYVLIEYLNLAVMSYDRHMSICHPLHYSHIMTSKKVCMLIALVWLYCFIQFSILVSLNLRLQLCGNVIEKVWCDNYMLVKLACSFTPVNNIYGLYVTFTTAALPLFLILYSYGKILKICWNSNKETKQKALNTCAPHIVSLLNFSVGCFFEVFQSRFDNIKMPAFLRTFISLYFLMCQPLLNPIMYGMRMTNIRKACKKVVFAVKLF